MSKFISYRSFRGTLKAITTLLIPGAAFIWQHQYQKAFLVPTLGLIWVVAFSLSRWIVDPYGFIFMNVGLVTIHISAILFALYHPTSSPENSSNKLALTILASIHAIIIVAGHTNKATVFGFQLYRIPSPSMAPTLAVGDIILVDTWAKHTIEPSQIVVFKRRANAITLVKRVTNLRKTDTTKEMYVLGDNARQSSDSRQFGWVSREFVQGRVTASLFNIVSGSHTKESYPKSF